MAETPTPRPSPPPRPAPRSVPPPAPRDPWPDPRTQTMAAAKSDYVRPGPGGRSRHSMRTMSAVLMPPVSSRVPLDISLAAIPGRCARMN
jgi:hypothetical protein